MAWDLRTFSSDPKIFVLKPVPASIIVPQRLSPYSVALMACAGPPLKTIDQCKASFACEGHEAVFVTPAHVMGNIFAIPIPLLDYLTSAPLQVQVLLECEGQVHRSKLELTALPTQVVAQAPYSSEHLPLHFVALTGNVHNLIAAADQFTSAELRTTDECGVEASALALFFGKRIIFSLLVWKMLGWPIVAVCQLLRARLEFQSLTINAEQFSSVHETVHERILGTTSYGAAYRPVKYQTGSVSGLRSDPIAIMLLQEIPFTEDGGSATMHEDRTRRTSHRRGSLDLILSAMESGSNH